ncbi:GMP reductase 2-like [Paramacrobiotus metropolitanus]|uniref:GMP reductase 2-like n=1 Tax=Paramacrobiotus metropolitanus TaxID=2943436 RepID=UPI0024465A18|nr:GMP reductase 2-like [Paramacrobiotus metropolitanus]
MPRVENDIKLDFKDVLIRPKRSTLKSREEVDLHRPYVFRHSKAEYHGIPIIAANMDSVGTLEMAKTFHQSDLFTALHKYYGVEEVASLLKEVPGIEKNIAISSGGTSDDLTRLQTISDTLPAIQFACLDVANGYTEFFVDYVRRVREALPHLTIMAGNVVTGEMVEQLILAGADIVKVGIGPGSVCTTRTKTGVGYPQLSAVMECADAAHGLNGHIISDGGCSVPGDIAKAFGGGADFVMLGGMLAGHDESAGEVMEDESGKKFKIFYGMSSRTAMDKHSTKLADYRASEGKTVRVPYRGPVQMTMRDILGGLRSACTYVGAPHLKELSKRTTFIRVTQQVNEAFRGLEDPKLNPVH